MRDWARKTLKNNVKKRETKNFILDWQAELIEE